MKHLHPASAPTPPSPDETRAAFEPQMTLYRRWLRDERGLRFDDYESLWRWSVDEPQSFWRSIWDYFDLQSDDPFECVLADAAMPGARWFPGAQVNYARQVFRHVEPAERAGMPAIVADDELGRRREVGWAELRRQVAALALHFRQRGVQPGDRVAAFLTNTPEAIVAFLATASIGAVWSICAPDMGLPAVLNRFQQIEPKVLIACDRMRNGGRETDLLPMVRQLHQGLRSVSHTLLVSEADALPDGCNAFLRDVTAATGHAVDSFEPVAVPFDHPLWIVYSSGTTGLPKAIVHGHGGVMLMMLPTLRLHNDLGASYTENSWEERFHWFSSTGWIVWNVQVSALLGGTTCCLYDGSPNGPREAPDWSTLWRFAARMKLTFFGAGAAFFAACMKAGVGLADCGDLRSVRAIGSTGSPLSEEAQRWGTSEFEALGRPDIWWSNASGGTDFGGAFIGGNRELPLVPGQLQCRMLGCAVAAFDETGRCVVDQVGELVCTKPMPSMPLYFWNDPDKMRYLASYFDVYPGIWRHGDWVRILPDGGCVIYGRSDATINRHGLRMGTSEFYSAIEALEGVVDSMVVDREFLGRASELLLFVVLRPGQVLDEALRTRIRSALRISLSPRFVPDRVIQAPEVPRTLSGKKLEVPIRRLLLGEPLQRVAQPDTMANPDSLNWYAQFAGATAATSPGNTLMSFRQPEGTNQ